MEIWKPIPDYERLYMASNLGRIKSLPRNGTIKYDRILVQGITKNGRYKVGLNKNDKRTWHNVHRLIAKAFIPRIEGKGCINHIDGNPLNNKVENLEWCTHSENTYHAFRIGLKSNHGEKHSQNKLTNEKVLRIRKMHAEGKANTVELAKLFGVCRPSISQIIHRKSWVQI